MWWQDHGYPGRWRIVQFFVHRIRRRWSTVYCWFIILISLSWFTSQMAATQHKNDWRVKSADWSSVSPRKPKAKDRGFLLKTKMVQFGGLSGNRKNTTQGFLKSVIKSFGPDPEIEEWYKDGHFRTNKDGGVVFEASITNTMSTLILSEAEKSIADFSFKKITFVLLIVLILE